MHQAIGDKDAKVKILAVSYSITLKFCYEIKQFCCI